MNSSESAAILRVRVPADFPLECVRAITQHAISGQLDWQAGGHASLVAAWGCCYADGSIFVTDGLGSHDALDISAAMCECYEALAGDPPPLAANGPIDLMQLFQLLLPLLLELLKKRS